MAYRRHLSGDAVWLVLRPFTDAVIMLLILGFTSLCHLACITREPDACSLSVDDEVDLFSRQKQKLITAVIEKTAGDRARAAVMLGISPTTLWRKMKRYGVGSA